MRWYYKLLRKDGNQYFYAYSTESKEYDGIIFYDTEAGEPIMIQACADDDNDFSKAWALRHFYIIIRENFPDELSVCIG